RLGRPAVVARNVPAVERALAQATRDRLGHEVNLGGVRKLFLDPTTTPCGAEGCLPPSRRPDILSFPGVSCVRPLPGGPTDGCDVRPPSSSIPPRSGRVSHRCATAVSAVVEPHH